MSTTQEPATKPTREQIQARIIQLSNLSSDDPKTYDAIETYIESLDWEDRLYAAHFGASIADQRIQQAVRNFR